MGLTKAQPRTLFGRPEPGLYDQTVGALEYGLADIGANLARNTGDTFGIETLSELGNYLNEFKTSHPEYAPEEVDDVWGLMSNPRALAGRVFGMAPQVILTAAVSKIPLAGPIVAGAMTYAIESQRGYDTAKLDGASEEDAQKAGHVLGAVNSLFNLLEVRNVFNFVKGADKRLISSVTNEVLKKGLGKSKETLGFLASQGLLNALQGSADELTRRQIYGKEVEPGFWDRRAQDIVGAAAAHSVFGLVGRKLKSVLEETKVEEANTTKPVVGPVNEAILSSQLAPNPSVLELVGRADQTLPNETPEDSSLRARIKNSLRAKVGGYLHSWSAGLLKTQTSEKVLEWADDADTYRRNVRGKYWLPLHEDQVRSSQDGSRSYLVAHDDDGFANIHKTFDPDSVPADRTLVPTDKTAPTGQIINDINGFLGSEASAIDLQTRRGGQVVPWTKPKNSKVPRIYTQDFYEMVRRGGGPGYERLLETVQEWNPDFSDRIKAHGFLQSTFGPGRVKVGALEEGRKIKVLPAYLKVKGSWVQILETDPHLVMEKAIDRQAAGLALIRQAGQGALDPIGHKDLVSVAKQLGVYKPIKDAEIIHQLQAKNLSEQNMLDNTPIKLSGKRTREVKDPETGSLKKVTEAVTPESLAAEAGIPFGEFDRLTKMNLVELKEYQSKVVQDPNGGYVQGLVSKLIQVREKAPFGSGDRLKKLAEAAGIQTEHTPASLLAEIKGYDVSTIDVSTPLGRKKYKDLQKIARSVQGIDARLEPGALKDAIVERLTKPVYDNGVEKMLDQYAREGGSREDLQSILLMAQGIPVHKQLPMAARIVSRIIGTAQTSLSLIPNLPQSLVQVPAMVGPGNFMKGLEKVWGQREHSAAEARAFGAILDGVRGQALVSGHRVENAVNNATRLTQDVLGVRRINEDNAIITAQATKAYLEGIRIHGASKVDREMLRALRFTDAEIAKAERGELSNHTFAKGVQNATSISQHTMEAPWHKSKLETSPLFGAVFAYQSYALGTGRYLSNLYGEWQNAVKTKDPAKLQRAATKSFLTMGGMLGAGLFVGIMKEAVKGNSQANMNEDTVEKGFAALKEVAFLGAAQRMMDAFNYSNGSFENAMIGMAPKIKAIADLGSALLGYGKYGRFALDDRLYAAVAGNTPILKAVTGKGVEFDGWVNRMAYPEADDYQRVRGAVGSYERRVLGRQGQPGINAPLNPDYYRVYEAVARGDMDAAREKITTLVRKEMKESAELGQPTSPVDILRRVRGSLVGRSPINLNDLEFVRYLGSLDPVKRKQFLQTHLSYMTKVSSLIPGSIL